MRVIIPENSNGNESSKIPPISKKYDIAILVFESSSKENISLHNISEKELFLDQYKEKIKAEIIDAITNKLSHQEEESKTQITEKNISNNLKIIEKSKIDLAEISSDEYTEESQANGEKVSIEQKYPKKDIEYYVNVWKTFSK